MEQPCRNNMEQQFLNADLLQNIKVYQDVNSLDNFNKGQSVLWKLQMDFDNMMVPWFMKRASVLVSLNSVKISMNINKT